VGEPGRQHHVRRQSPGESGEDEERRGGAPDPERARGGLSGRPQRRRAAERLREVGGDDRREESEGAAFDEADAEGEVLRDAVERHRRDESEPGRLAPRVALQEKVGADEDARSDDEHAGGPREAQLVVCWNEQLEDDGDDERTGSEGEHRAAQRSTASGTIQARHRPTETLRSRRRTGPDCAWRARV
jgi:hypothetical protein